MRNNLFIIVALIAVITPFVSLAAGPAGLDEFALYQKRMDGVITAEDIVANGFFWDDEHIFPMELVRFGAVDLLPALDTELGRIVLFFVDGGGMVVYKTDSIENNYVVPSSLKQPNIEILATKIQDLNGNGLDDIIIISACKNESGPNAGKPYNIGEVLFQSETGLYRDWRLSDRINRFSMNTDFDMVRAFVRDGMSSEYLYSAQTLGQLEENGFQIIRDRNVFFEKWGELRVVSGVCKITRHNILMVYLLDSDGRMVWNFQPMGNYTNFNWIMGTSFEDIDGDGLTDAAFLIRYDVLTEAGETVTVQDYSIYYQRTGYFYEDDAFKAAYQCGWEDTLPDIVERARVFYNVAGLR